jgi:prepilin-type N-terminal cleavage/methylation domain-containing protein
MSLKNNRGLTIIELLVALGIASVGLSIVALTQVSLVKEQTRLTKKLEANIDETLAERILFNDFNGLDPSYNNLNIKDDSGLLFFDFYPDVPEANLKTKKDRQITLSPRGTKVFYILTQDRSAGSLLIYDPVMAYDVGPASADYNVAATLNFKSLNKNNWVKAQRPGFWQNGKVLMMDTPAQVRAVKNGVLDLQVAPRSPILLGTVTGDSLVPLTGEFGSLIINTDPDSGVVIGSADAFLRNLPSIGGGQSIVRMRAAKLVKYEVIKDESSVGYKTETSKLYRSVYSINGFSNKTLLADRIEKFSLRRDSVLKRMIYFKVFKAESL